MDSRIGSEINSKKGQTLLRAAKDRKLWKAMVAHALKGHGRKKQNLI